jgi:hypothetical protein
MLEATWRVTALHESAAILRVSEVADKRRRFGFTVAALL